MDVHWQRFLCQSLETLKKEKEKRKKEKKNEKKNAQRLSRDEELT